MQKATSILIVLILSSVGVYAAKYLLPNEDVIFSFTTARGKKMMLAENTDLKYIVYRFGTKDKIELEYYSKATDSPKKISYYGFFRPVTDGIYGVDENTVDFYIGNIRYAVYDNGHELNAEEGGTSDRKAGITITDTLSKKETGIKANLKTLKGSLHGMWYNDLFRQR